LVSPFVLAVLKYVFLALVYFFVFRAIRAMATEIRAPKTERVQSAKTRQVRTGGKARGKGGGKPPTTVVVRAEDGKRLARHPLSSTLQIGRAEACHVRIEDRYASQFHARLYARDGTWFLEDLGSTNGTYLNRQRVSGSAEIHSGDEIRIGRTTLELKR
jgi:pSer/pThr/pTyr-binding forkhead associated (FHA) protein